MEEVLGTENIRKEAISFIYVKSHQDLGSLLHQSLLLNPEGPQITILIRDTKPEKNTKVCVVNHHKKLVLG